MKLGTWRYLGGFLLFGALVVVILVQNLSASAGFAFLWTSSVAFPKLVLRIAFFGLLQGAFLTLFLNAFFSGIKRPELSKFDLEKPL